MATLVDFTTTEVLNKVLDTTKNALSVSLDTEQSGSIQTVKIDQTTTNNDVDVISVVPGTGATNLGKAEDGAHTSADVGVMMLGVRTDTTAAKSDTDGDYEPIQVKTGRLVVDASGVAVPVTDNSGSLTIDSAQLPTALTASGNLKISIQEDGGAVIGVDDNAGSLTVDAPAGTPVAVRPSDGTSAQTFFESDMDSGAGTQNRIGMAIIAPASGGAVVIPGDTTNGLDVDVTRVSGNVTVVQTTAANLNMTEASASAIKTAVELIDDTVYTDGTGTPSKAIGVAGTDGTNPQILKTDTNGELQIDVLSIAAGNNNIGDVDIASAIPAGTNVIGGVTGGGIYVAATITPVASGTADVQGIAAAANTRLVGWSITEDAATAAAAEVILRHGTLVSDPIIAQVNLAANESIRDWFGPDGIGVANGVFVDRVSGTTALTLFTKVVA